MRPLGSGSLGGTSCGLVSVAPDWDKRPRGEITEINIKKNNNNQPAHCKRDRDACRIKRAHDPHISM